MSRVRSPAWRRPLTWGRDYGSLLGVTLPLPLHASQCAEGHESR
jgi:hypothetical protein